MNKTGFGFLRLPRDSGGDIDFEVLNSLVDRFLELGGTYFDTAYSYMGGASENALRRSLVERHPRSSFILADKLPGYQVQTDDDCRKFYEESLRRCGVDHFDVYLLHWLNEENYATAERFRQFQFLQSLKDRGEVGKIGFSYHDGPELLDRILTAHPEVDYVQLQINYLDWDSPSLQARACYEVAEKHGKKVIVMEPVKGGSLAKLPEEAAGILHTLAPRESAASWAIRFAGSLPQVEITLSGMNAMEQMEDNMRRLHPLTEAEKDTLARVAGIIRSRTAVPCTGCGYCVSHCPIGMPIPQILALYNDYARDPGDDWKMQHAYDSLAAANCRASECVRCRQCEANCPQKIGITDFLAKAAAAFEH